MHGHTARLYVRSQVATGQRMRSTTAPLLLSLILIPAAFLKLIAESPSHDQQHLGWLQYYVIHPNTLFQRAIQRLENNKPEDLVEARKITEGLLATNLASADRWC